MEVDITLSKAKYRNPNCRTIMQSADGGRPIPTRIVQTGFASKSQNSGRKGDKGQVLRPRKRAYGPWWWELGHAPFQGN